MASEAVRFGDSALDRTTVTIRQGPLIGPVLSRAVAIHAARAPLPVDRLNDALLVADAIAARAPAFCVGERLPVSLRAADGRLDLRIGPLREGGAERVLEGATSKKPTQSHPETGVLDLGNEKDVADFLLRKKGESGPSSDGYESAASSASSVAGDDGDAVDLADDYVGRNNKRGQKRAVKLDEIGPRIELKLIKVAEGVPGREGNVLYHEFGKLISTYFQETILKGISSQKVQG